MDFQMDPPGVPLPSHKLYRVGSQQWVPKGTPNGPPDGPQMDPQMDLEGYICTHESIGLFSSAGALMDLKGPLQALFGLSGGTPSQAINYIRLSLQNRPRKGSGGTHLN